MALKHVEKVRPAIVRNLITALARTRLFVSMTDGNQEAVEKLRGENGDLILAKATDLILRELGHETAASVETASSHVRRQVARVRGKGSDAIADIEA